MPKLLFTPVCEVHLDQGIETGESGLFFDPSVNTYGAAAKLPVTYGGELLYLRIWHDYLAWSAHIIVTVWFIAQ